MLLIKFLNNLFKYNGFLLEDAYGNKHVIGKPKSENALKMKIHDKKLHYKLLLYPDLYFGEAYTNGSLKIENGTLTEFLEIALRNIGRGDINIYGKIFNKLKGTYRYLTNFNKGINSKKNVSEKINSLYHSSILSQRTLELLEWKLFDNFSKSITNVVSKDT